MLTMMLTVIICISNLIVNEVGQPSCGRLDGAEGGEGSEGREGRPNHRNAEIDLTGTSLIPSSPWTVLLLRSDSVECIATTKWPKRGAMRGTAAAAHPRKGARWHCGMEIL